jgi:hypothetical protein
MRAQRGDPTEVDSKKDEETKTVARRDTRRKLDEKPVRVAFWNPEAEYLGFRLTSETTRDLTIEKVVYNGEFKARIAKAEFAQIELLPGFPAQTTDHLVFMVDENARFPVHLNIGEHVDIFWRNFGNPFNYSKDVIFIDVFTNSGTFRYTRTGRFAE